MANCPEIWLRIKKLDVGMVSLQTVQHFIVCQREWRPGYYYDEYWYWSNCKNSCKMKNLINITALDQDSLNCELEPAKQDHIMILQ